MAKTAVVGLSGGVDSSAAAALLLEQGYAVVGVTLRHLPDTVSNSCCSLEAVVDARRVAKKLGIPHYLVDVEQPFFERVITPFENGYLAGTTPNPCALCNRHIKFGALWDWAHSQGADFLATGHYVRVTEEQGRFVVRRARDRKKDQSYLLYTLDQTDLAHLLFPLGNLTKDESREIARSRGLVTASKPDSQELCFVPKNDYAGYLAARRPEAIREGEIRDTEGRVLGQHQGVAFYTVGQRKGLGIAGTRPHYVVALDAERNRVVVGDRDRVEHDRVMVADTAYVDGYPPPADVAGGIKIRYNMEPAPGVWHPEGQGAVVQFARPQWAPSPGQVAALYEDDRLIGGGRIVGAS